MNSNARVLNEWNKGLVIEISSGTFGYRTQNLDRDREIAAYVRDNRNGLDNVFALTGFVI